MMTRTSYYISSGVIFRNSIFFFRVQSIHHSPPPSHCLLALQGLSQHIILFFTLLSIDLLIMVTYRQTTMSFRVAALLNTTLTHSFLHFITIIFSYVFHLHMVICSMLCNFPIWL